ncbi:MAG: 3-keto-5-aminohexanoate cleavage protein [Xanthobacteraceae bacterium]
MARATAPAFEHECHDVGHLYNLAHCIDCGLFKPPVFLQLIFGILGGIGPDMENLTFMKATADKLFGNEHSVARRRALPDAVCDAGDDDGRHVRVTEDSLFIARGKPATSNAEQV